MLLNKLLVTVKGLFWYDTIFTKEKEYCICNVFKPKDKISLGFYTFWKVNEKYVFLLRRLVVEEYDSSEHSIDELLSLVD